MTDAIDDARGLFNDYMDLTKPAIRCVPIEGQENAYTYPARENQQDMMVFATIFTCVWQAIKGDFGTHYNNPVKKAQAFWQLERLTVPNPDSRYNAFFRQVGTTIPPCDVMTEDGMRHLCRTLRNGFNHFNFRYDNMAPDAYFVRLGKPIPASVRDVTTVANYRIFICDHLTSARRAGATVPLNMMDPGSDTRILEVGFAHLRYHLYGFLSRFFEAEGGRAHVDLFHLRFT